LVIHSLVSYQKLIQNANLIAHEVDEYVK